MPPTRPRRPAKSGTRAPRKNTKITGERSEASFLARAIQLNFGVAKPWGDSLRYDFILDNGERLFRFQVKATECLRAQAYETRATYTAGKGRAVYTRADIDFIAAHVAPLDIWYIIPVEECMSKPMLRFYPHRKAKRMRLERFREAWHQVLPERTNKPDQRITIHAQAHEEIDSDKLLDLVDSHHPMDPLDIVILSEGADPGSGSAPQSKDPYHPKAAAVVRRHFQGDAHGSSDELLRLYRNLCRHTSPTTIPQSSAPWPIPALKILAPRKGKRILPDPE